MGIIWALASSGQKKITIIFGWVLHVPIKWNIFAKDFNNNKKKQYHGKDYLLTISAGDRTDCNKRTY